MNVYTIVVKHATAKEPPAWMIELKQLDRDAEAVQTEYEDDNGFERWEVGTVLDWDAVAGVRGVIGVE